MSSFKKIMDIYILLISIITIVSPNEKNTSLEYCDIDKYCDKCTLCGNGTNDYSPCSYYNLFCTEKSTDSKNSTIFKGTYKNKYSTFFRSISNANEFCGQEKYSFNSVIKSFTIINKSNKNIKDLNINHCNYEIYNRKYFNNKFDVANLKIKFNTNNSQKNNLKLIFNILLQNSRTQISFLSIVNEMDLIKQPYEITLNDYDTIAILLDFYLDDKTITNINESLEIRIETDNQGNKLNKIINIVLIVVFSVVGVAIIASIIFAIYRRKKNRDMVRIQNQVLQQDEVIRTQKVEKINKLFETKLKSKEFNENNITNDCTECAICIEKFVNKCLVCVTPCKHIFHYECLKKFVETAKNKQNPVIKCPLCNYDFLEENDNKKLNEINNTNNRTNNNENNNNEINNNGVNNNENMQQNNIRDVRSSVINVNSNIHDVTSEENLRNHNV